ncbi:MAG: site-2 protease family protein [Dehalococcoidia bacterium]|nr:site-2 protease family protein [Dehalococcoidia bacterium]
MGSSLRLGKILGIEIRLHYSWFIIFALVTMFFYTDFQAAEYSVSVSLAMGLVSSLLIFLSVVAHELAHSVVAIRSGIPVRSITLFVLGGVASIAKEADRPKTEILMAMAGPACSLTIGLASGAAWFATGGHLSEATAFHSVLFWMAVLNLQLGVFNLLPGFPMDGGRVLRSILWQRTRDYRRATHIASIAGQAIGWAIAGVGVVIAVTYLVRGPATAEVIADALFSGGYLVLLGWFLSSIAASSYRQVAWREAMKGITASSAMVSDFRTIPPGMSLMELVRDYIQPNRSRSFVVATDGRLQGVVNIENIRKVPQSRWDMTTAASVMTPVNKVITATPEEEGVSIAEKMEEHRLDGIPVLRDGVVVGLVTRNSLARVMQMRAQFGTR